MYNLYSGRNLAEDQCIMMIQEMLQVENAFHLQVIREGQDTQLSLSWRTLDEKKKKTDVCKNCNTFDLNDRINKLLLIILGKAEDGDDLLISKSKDWLRIFGNRNVFSIYYKFLGNFGLGLSSITSEPEKNVCVGYYINGDCRLIESLKVHINGVFLQLGYDFELNPIIFNTNLGLAVNGTVTSSGWYYDYDRKIDQSSSYTLFVSLAYRGSKEYGIGFNYTKLKQQGDNKLSTSTWNSSSPPNWTGYTHKTIDSYQITESRPVLWFGLNW